MSFLVDTKIDIGVNSNGHCFIQAPLDHRLPLQGKCVDSAGSSGVAGTPTSFVNGRRQYGDYDIDTLTAAVKTAKAQPKLDVPYRRGQVDDKQADAAVLPAWSAERAFRRRPCIGTAQVGTDTSRLDAPIRSPVHRFIAIKIL
jgi:hypothetical protein